MAHEWTQEIRTRFPDWKTSDALIRWPTDKARLKIGQQVSGTVIARAPFGVWLDIGAAHPALMEATEMARPGQRPVQSIDWPPTGTNLTATIVALGDKAEIALSQFPDGSYWSKHRAKKS
jgi:hypothetical protein